MTKDEKNIIKDKLIEWGQAEKFIVGIQTEINEWKDKINLKEFKIMVPEYNRRIKLSEERILKLAEAETVMYDILLCLDKLERDIIYYRYRNGISWDFMPEKIGYSRMQCFRIHNKALEKLWEYLRE